MKWKPWRPILGLLVLLMVAACTPERDESELFAPEFLDVLVVDATLIVGRPHPTVKLSRTLAPNVPFNPDTAGETGATITIESSGQTVEYSQLPGRPGLYGPVGPGGTILPETEYRLLVESDRGETLTAVTVTPSRFNVDEWVLLNPAGTAELRTLETFATAGDSVYFRPENQITYAEGLLEARFAPGGAENFAAVGYQLSLFSIDYDSDYVIDPPFFEDEDFEDLARMGSSPALDGLEGQVRLPWFGIYYQGRYLYKVYTLDLNWYDLVRTRPLGDGGLGFGGNVGDSPDNPTFHVNGGIGLFGSASVDSVGFFILPQE